MIIVRSIFFVLLNRCQDNVEKQRDFQFQMTNSKYQNNMKKTLTLCIIHQHPKVLLGMKKRGFGKGRWNGFGGKVERGETIEDAAKRETEEEAGIEISKMDKLGVVEFEFRNNPEISEVHIFYVEKFEGNPVESEEMKPKWFEVSELPFDQMWPDDKHWFPLFLERKRFKGKFSFDETDKIIDFSLLETE